MNAPAAWIATVVSAGLRLALFGVGAVLTFGYLFFGGTEMTSKSGQLQIVIGICCFVAVLLPPWAPGRVATAWTTLGAIAAIVLGVGVNEWLKEIVTTSHIGYLCSAVGLGIGVATVSTRRGEADKAKM